MNKLIVLALLALASTANAADRSVAERGRKNYVEFGCVKCHGIAGQGSVSGLKLAPDILPADAIITFLRGTTGPMPRYGAEIISDAQIIEIHAYLESRPKPASPDSIAALKDIRGKR